MEILRKALIERLGDEDDRGILDVAKVSVIALDIVEAGVHGKDQTVSAVIRKIHNLEPITSADLSELERILWHELGTKAEYDEATDIGNLAAFVRSLIGLSQEAVNVKFGEYLSGNLLNFQQQEFVRTIINYVRENGDVELFDMVNSEPFNNYDLNEIFGINLPAMISVVRTLHDVVQAA